MNYKSLKILVSLFFLLFALNGCADQLGKAKSKPKKFKQKQCSFKKIKWNDGSYL